MTARGRGQEGLLRTVAELRAVVERNPLVDTSTNHSRLMVTFLSEPPDPARFVDVKPADVAPDEFAATLNSAVVVGDHVAFPQGSEARVRLVEAKKSGHYKGSSQLELELASITANGVTYPVESGYYTLNGASRGKRTAETVGGGAVLGTLIGAIAGGRKGAAIGAGAGAATGAGVQTVTRGPQVKIPSETKIDFTLKSPVTVK